MGKLIQLRAIPLESAKFAEYGRVIEKAGSENFPINNGNCVRHHNLATVDVKGKGGETGISIFSAKPYQLPLKLEMVERHPLGSQAFFPLGEKPWLVIVCEDSKDGPINPTVFLATADQGINLNRGVWHGVLTPLGSASDFLVVDRVGDGDNLEEFFFQQPFEVVL